MNIFIMKSISINVTENFMLPPLLSITMKSFRLRGPIDHLAFPVAYLLPLPGCHCNVSGTPLPTMSTYCPKAAMGLGVGDRPAIAHLPPPACPCQWSNSDDQHVPVKGNILGQNRESWSRPELRLSTRVCDFLGINIPNENSTFWGCLSICVCMPACFVGHIFWLACYPLLVSDILLILASFATLPCISIMHTK